MSDKDQNKDQDRKDTGDRSPQVGALLRASRLRVGEDLREISDILCIRYLYLEAIEDCRYGDLPGNTYAVGFIRSYAEHLGLDGDEVVRRYRLEQTGQKGATDLAFPTPVPDSGVPKGAIVFIGVLIALLVYGGWYATTTDESILSDLISPVPDHLKHLVTGDDAPAGTDAAATDEDAAAPDTAESAASDVEQVVRETTAAAEQMANAAGEAAQRNAEAAAEAATETATAAEQADAAADAVVETAETVTAETTDAVESTAETVSEAVQPEGDATAAPDTSAAASQMSETATETATSQAAEADAPDTQSTESASAGSGATDTQTGETQSGESQSGESQATETQTAEAEAEATPQAADTQATETEAAETAATQQANDTAPAETQAAETETAETPADETPTAETEAAEATGANNSEEVTAEQLNTLMLRQATGVSDDTSAPSPPETASTGASETVGTSGIVIRATSSSWVEIRDPSSGDIVFTGLMSEGNSFNVPDIDGLTLDTGNAGALEISVDGTQVPQIGGIGAVRKGVILDAERLKAGTAAGG